MGKLDNKVTIVTGASRGIGKAIALLFGAEGAKVVCGARTLQEGQHALEGSLNTTVSEIREAGGTAIAVQVDLSSEDSCVQLVETAKKNFGPVDILVNNAGVNFFSSIKDLPSKRWMLGFAINVNAAFFLCQKVLPEMIERRRGAIINISSLAAEKSPDLYKPTGTGDTMYGASKAALNRFTQGLAEEVYEHGISVSAVAPLKLVITPGALYHKLVDSPDDPRGEPPELMAKAVLLLATEPIDKVTGRITNSQAILKEFHWI